MVFAIFQPSPIGRVAVASFFALERVRVFILNALPNLAEQSKKTLGKAISFPHTLRVGVIDAAEQFDQLALFRGPNPDSRRSELDLEATRNDCVRQYLGNGAEQK